jgi:hypothetical protein
VLLVVGGAPVLGAPVADAEQQGPPAGAHGGGGGERGRREAPGAGGGGRREEASRVEGFGSGRSVGARGFGHRYWTALPGRCAALALLGG